MQQACGCRGSRLLHLRRGWPLLSPDADGGSSSTRHDAVLHSLSALVVNSMSFCWILARRCGVSGGVPKTSGNEQLHAARKLLL